MPIISKLTSCRVESGVYCVSDYTGRRNLVIEINPNGMSILNSELVKDYVPSADYVGGDINSAYLKIRIGGVKDTWYPVKSR